MYLVYYASMVGLNARANPRIVIDKALPVGGWDFSPLYKTREKLTKDLQNKLLKLKRVLGVV
jgi:hypothetical protein